MDKIEMSLDDIIKFNRSQNKKSPSGDRESSCGRRVNKVSKNRSGREVQKSQRKPGGGIIKGRGSGGIQKAKYSRANVNNAGKPKPSGSVWKGRRSGDTKKSKFSNGNVSRTRNYNMKQRVKLEGDVLKGRDSAGIQKVKYSRANVNNAGKSKLHDEPKPSGSIWKGRRSGDTKKSKFSNGNASSTRNYNMINGVKAGGDVVNGRDLTATKKAKFSSARRHNENDGYKRNIFKSSNSTKILVSNLDYGVSDSDIRELFTELGPMKKAAIHYDRSGRSLGTADLVYERRSDALKAIKQYNGVALDGRTMQIQSVTEMSSLTRRLGSRPASQQKRTTSVEDTRKPGVGSGKRRRGQTNRNRSRQYDARHNIKKRAPNVGELDAQLDAYMSEYVQPNLN